MALLEIGSQYRFTGKGPFDAKCFVKTFNDLTKRETWTSQNNFCTAYNGMIVAVGLDPIEENNGIYYLHDPEVTSVFIDPDVTTNANWHRLADISAVGNFTSRLTAIEDQITEFEEEIQNLNNTRPQTYASKTLLPEEGVEGKLYIVLDESSTYVYTAGRYLRVSTDINENTVIHGGSAD